MHINRKILWLVLLPICLLGSIQDVISGEIPNEEEIKNEVFNNISEEYSTCSAYFRIMSEALRRSGDNETEKQYEQGSDKTLEIALMAAQEGRTLEMAEKVVMARIELNTKSMLKEIDNNIENISILMNQHLIRCQEIMEDPDKVMAEWSGKIFKKYNLD